MNYYIGNLKPSEALYLQENIADEAVAEAFRRELSEYLQEGGKCIASLDEVFCNAAMLRSTIDQVSDDELRNIFVDAVETKSTERAAAFLDGLGQKRDKEFRSLIGVARKFG